MKKCPYCAEIIQDEAIVCRYCGRDLSPTPSPPEAQPPSSGPHAPAPALRVTPSLKKPWLAVVLNLFLLIMGLGYLYLGLWRRFLVVFLIQILSLAPMTFIGLREYNKYLLFGLWLFTLIDVRAQAVAQNRRILSRHTQPQAPGTATA